MTVQEYWSYTYICKKQYGINGREVNDLGDKVILYSDINFCYAGIAGCLKKLKDTGSIDWGNSISGTMTVVKGAVAV